MNKNKECCYLSIETLTIETTPYFETHLQCINDECEYYLGFIDNGECKNCKNFTCDKM